MINKATIFTDWTMTTNSIRLPLSGMRLPAIINNITRMGVNKKLTISQRQSNRECKDKTELEGFMLISPQLFLIGGFNNP